jgi:hypothetical protein
MVELPAAEDEAERLMDDKPFRFALDLSLADFRLLTAEQERRRRMGLPFTKRAIILDALRSTLPGRN